MSKRNFHITRDFIFKATAGGVIYYILKLPELRRKDENKFHNISSPFRSDRNPSFSIFRDRSTNTWLHKDFGDSSTMGDVFSFAARLHGLNNKIDFQEVLSRMYKDLRIDEIDSVQVESFINGWASSLSLPYSFEANLQQSANSTIVENQKKLIGYVAIAFGDLNKAESQFLKSNQIDYKVMLQNKTEFIKSYKFVNEIGKEIIKNKPADQVWICYDHGSYLKIYCPNPKRFWFVGTKTGRYIYGTPNIHEQFDQPTTVFLVGGEKDVLTLMSQGYNAMCLNSETSDVKQSDVKDWYFYNKYKVIILYDIDDTGISRVGEINKETGLSFLLLPDWVKEKGGKDISDFFALGGSKQEFDQLIQQIETKDKSPIIEKRLSLRTAQQRLLDAVNLPEIEPIFDVFFQSGELVILFGDTGKGKSIFAVALADSISRGQDFGGFENRCGSSVVLYYDFELSDKQFQKRYSSKDGRLYPFDSNCFIDNIDLSKIDFSSKKISLEEHLIKIIRDQIKETAAKIVIIDNITFLAAHSTEDGQVAMKLMKLLKELKAETGVSILVLAHTPKKHGINGVSIADLAGSKHLSNFSDGVFSLAASKKDPNLRYLIQVKGSRSGEVKYDSENVVVCEIQKMDSLLTFEFRGFDKESNHLFSIGEDDNVELIEQAKALRKEGKSYFEIATILERGKSTVGRWLKPS